MPEPLPENVRRLRGTDRPDRKRNTPQPVAKAPEMPADFPEAAAEAWERIVPESERLGLISQLDYDKLVGYCTAVAVRERVSAELFESELAVRDENHGGVKKTPLWQMYRDACLLVETMARGLPVSPGERLKMHLPEVEDNDDLLDS